jgi:hypothetical protein
MVFRHIIHRRDFPYERSQKKEATQKKKEKVSVVGMRKINLARMSIAANARQSPAATLSRTLHAEV